MEKTFFVDGFVGEAQGGYFVRNDLFKFFQILEKKGLKPIGIKVEDGWNLEIIVAKIKEK